MVLGVILVLQASTGPHTEVCLSGPLEVVIVFTRPASLQKAKHSSPALPHCFQGVLLFLTGMIGMINKS